MRAKTMQVVPLLFWATSGCNFPTSKDWGSREESKTVLI